MKIPLLPFAVLATRYKCDDFWRARLKLTTFYVAIIAVILGLFSGFLYMQVADQLETLATQTVGVKTITPEEAMAVAKEVVPAGVVSEIEEGFVNGVFTYDIELQTSDGEYDVYINRQTGELLGVSGEDDTFETFGTAFVNEFEENIILANFWVLLISGFLSYLLAGRTLRPIQAKMRQQEQFSNDVAHEIRTPLSAMYATAESVLRKVESVESYQSAISDFKTETKRLIDLTEDLLLSARGLREIEKSEVRLVKILEQATKRLDSFANEKGVAVTHNVMTETNVFGNKIMLERLFQNILHNAIKFTPKGGSVIIEIHDHTVTVVDSGVGMATAVQKKVFDRLYTTDTARDERGVRGTGLGLPIVQQIATVHNAVVTLESEAGKGTCVQVTFLQ